MWDMCTEPRIWRWRLSQKQSSRDVRVLVVFSPACATHPDPAETSPCECQVFPGRGPGRKGIDAKLASS